MTKMIPLNKGKHTLVSDEDYGHLSQYTWYLDSSGYATAAIGFHRKTTRMNRLIMDTPKGMDCHHINGDKLDNRRENLINCAHAENLRSRGLFRNNTTGYTGVSWDKQMKKFRAWVKVDGDVIHVGYFDTAEKAARARDLAARIHHGEFVHLNFPA